MWEGSELSFYYNGESYSIPLSNKQFIIIANILGLKIDGDSVVCFSDATLDQIQKMSGNPLNLKAQI